LPDETPDWSGFALSLSAATVDGLKIHWSGAGNGAKTVLFVLGWTCNETTWSEQVPVLAKQYRVLTLDLQGHGQSYEPRDGKFSMDLFAQAVEAVRAEAKADGLILAGQGMGTQVVLRYARLYPQHTAAAVFVDGVTTRVEGPLRADRRGATIAKSDPQPVLGGYHSGDAGQNPQDDVGCARCDRCRNE
jgi:pimeloyl-ACP methyl ester carboxylesterase